MTLRTDDEADNGGSVDYVLSTSTGVSNTSPARSGRRGTRCAPGVESRVTALADELARLAEREGRRPRARDQRGGTIDAEREMTDREALLGSGFLLRLGAGAEEGTSAGAWSAWGGARPPPGSKDRRTASRWTGR